MNWYEEMIFSMALGVLHQVIKNPAKQAALKTLLLGFADDVYGSYGLTPPAHS